MLRSWPSLMLKSWPFWQILEGYMANVLALVVGRLCWDNDFWGLDSRATLTMAKILTLQHIHIYIYIYTYAIGFKNGARFLDS